jgi:hypothetical protein
MPIPSNTKFHGTRNVSVKNRGSKLANSNRDAYTIEDIASSVTVDGLTHKFPIQSGQTISKNEFVQLNDAGAIFGVEETGSVPITIPIGSPEEYSQTLNPNQSRDNLVRFIDNDENFILFFAVSGAGGGCYFQGGRVDSLGNFTYLNAPTQVEPVSEIIEFDIDETSFGQPIVKGCFTYGGTSSSNLFAQAFEYTVTTQTFVFGIQIDLGINLVDNDSSGLITNIGAGKYVIASTRGNKTFIITVAANLAITKLADTTIPSNRERGHFVKISNDKVIFLVLNSSYFQAAYIFDTSGNSVTIGNSSASSWNNFNFSAATRQIDSENNFYMCSPGSGGGNRLVSQQTYDVLNDIVVFNNNRLELDTSIFVSDIAFNPATDVTVVSGNTSLTATAAIIDFGTSTIINKVVGVSTGNQNSSAINSNGDIVFNYSNGNIGTTSYGKLGDILSDLDPEKTIGVASDGLGNVEISGSVITDSSLALVINKTVYVNGVGSISTTFSDGSIAIGYSISSTSFILNINK